MTNAFVGDGWVIPVILVWVATAMIVAGTWSWFRAGTRHGGR